MRERTALSGTALKCIALVCMTVDHAAAVLVPEDAAVYLVLRGIGRQAFPVYCFLLAQGDVHTRSRGRYLARLVLFGLLSEVPFDLALHGSLFEAAFQNVFWTLSLGEGVLWAFARIRQWDAARGKAAVFAGGFSETGSLAALAVLLAAMAAADLLSTDYGSSGVLLIALFALTRESGYSGLILTAGIAALCWWGNVLQLTALFSIGLLLPLYSGERGKGPGRLVFYLYYPLHLLLLAAFATLV